MERGQFLERMTVIDAGEGRVLDGLYQSGRGGRPTLLLTGHRALGGTMEAPVPTELCWALCQAGRPTLRFHWRGVGGSTGPAADRALEPPDASRPLDAYLEDARAALVHLGETCPGAPVDVVGFSFGARVARALRPSAGGPALGRIVLVTPPEPPEEEEEVIVIPGVAPRQERGLPELARRVLAALESPGE